MNKVKLILLRLSRFYRGLRLIVAVSALGFILASSLMPDIIQLFTNLLAVLCLLVLFGNSIQAISETNSIGIYERSERIYKLIHKIAEYATEREVNITSNTPTIPQAEVSIVIYQMGKVGSRSVESSISNLGYTNVHHIHYLQLSNLLKVLTERLDKGEKVSYHAERSLMIWKSLVIEKHYAKYITIVRNPIDRNFSAFFHGYRHYTSSPTDGFKSTTENIKLFFDRYEHDIPLKWFQEELNPILGIDVFNHPFPMEQGYQRLTLENGELLILKLESGRSVMEKAIREFLDLERFNLSDTNLASQKGYYDSYTEFKKEISLPSDYVEHMLNSQYTQHFYSESERNKIRDYWDNKRR